MHSAGQMIEAGGPVSDGDLAGAEAAMARSLMLYRRGQARVATANSCCMSDGLTSARVTIALANDEFSEAAMLIPLVS